MGIPSAQYSAGVRFMFIEVNKSKEREREILGARITRAAFNREMHLNESSRKGVGTVEGEISK